MAITMEVSRAAAAREASDISPLTAGYGLSAAVTAIFNTVFAWVKDATPALQKAMENALGHHWTTHGVVDVALFLILGYVLSRTNVAQQMTGNRLANLIVGGSVLGGLGLAAWFFLV